MSAIVVCHMVVTGMTGADLTAGLHDQDDVRTRIVGATSTLTGCQDAPPTTETIAGAVLELLDISATVTPDNQYQAEITNRIAGAKDRIRDGSIFDDKVRPYLSFASG